jgi:hypothetical protein
MRRFVGVLAALGIAACSSGGSSPPPPPPTGGISLYNNSGNVIDEVYVVPAPASGWPDFGAPRNVTAVNPGTTFTVSGLAPGLWWAQAINYGLESDFYAYGFDIPVVAGQTAQIVANYQNFTGSLVVTNGNSVYTLTGLYVVPPSSTTWGNNFITYPLAYGQYFHLFGMPPQSYDVRCVHSDGVATDGTYAITSFTVTYVTCS